ncbi:exodeoxyribonuclease V subunit gamma [Simkania negevensis]|uniref:RecBCD enzyme subunit RecC n=1 Tax=Simkania negevensis TaxID=83561 RepID=A0ABS3AUT8_9BACT|nr:exodeoxyribonuclease V subunit gamma [Simkania negevensis]
MKSAAIVSNRVELLYEALKKALFSSSGVFTKRIIAVPSLAMRDWLKASLAEDPALEVFFGCDIVLLDRAVELLGQEVDEERKRVAEPFELTLKIHALLSQMVDQYDSMAVDEQERYTSLINYLHHAGTTSNDLTNLCSHLADLFLRYGLHGKEMVEFWTGEEGWQQKLWTSIFGTNGHWIPLYKQLALLTISPLAKETHVHLFVLSGLSKTHQDFFAHLADTLPVYYYVLSPCGMFWEDSLTKPETKRLFKYWDKKKAKESQLDELEEYLRDHNALLANFGRLGREYLLSLEETSAHIFSHYLLPKSIANLNAYSDLLPATFVQVDTQHPPTLLQAVQADMLLFRNPATPAPILFPEQENSIELHIAPSLHREVEILYHNLTSCIMQTHNTSSPIKPRDIIVMAPDIHLYLPYIYTIFNHPESILAFQIADLSLLTNNSLAKGLLHLFTLAKSRWDAVTLINLFEHLPFQQRHQLTPDDVQQIRSWIQTAGIRWGIDCTHRNQLLAQDAIVHQFEEGEEGATWQQGFRRLVNAFTIMDEDDEHSALHVEMLRGELLGKSIHLIESLYNDLKPLIDGTHLSIAKWREYLSLLLNTYFAPKGDSDEYRLLTKQIETLRTNDLSLNEQEFPFDLIRSHLEKSVSHEMHSIKDNNIQTIRFCSMLPMRAIPAKVVCLLGMHQGGFPRRDQKDSLNLMLVPSPKSSSSFGRVKAPGLDASQNTKDFRNRASGNPSIGYLPSRADYDRYLFLEALLSARQHLIISYPREDSNKEETHPSLLVSELMSYLDQGYTIADQHPSQALSVTHPTQGYHKSYFDQAEPRLKCFFNTSYSDALSYYQTEKKKPALFIPNIVKKPPPLSEQTVKKTITIHLAKLRQSIHSPLQTYFNETLSIYLNDKHRQLIESEEDFFLSPLMRYKLQKKALKQRLEEVINKSDQDSLLPLGPFKKAAINELTNSYQQIQRTLNEANISENDLFTIEFREGQKTATQETDKAWLLPPISLNLQGTPIDIVGKINDLSPQGMISISKHGPTQTLKSWPLLLALAEASQYIDIPSQLHFLPDNKKIIHPPSTERKVLWQGLIEYYLLSAKQPCPILPDWINLIVQGDDDALARKIRQTLLSQQWQDNIDEYLHWVLNNKPPPAKLIIEQWQQTLANAFSNALALQIN